MWSNESISRSGFLGLSIGQNLCRRILTTAFRIQNVGRTLHEITARLGKDWKKRATTV